MRQLTERLTALEGLRLTLARAIKYYDGVGEKGLVETILEAYAAVEKSIARIRAELDVDPQDIDLEH
jgi:hypothetical protein